jgi:hypothetical protein
MDLGMSLAYWATLAPSPLKVLHKLKIGLALKKR